MLLRLCQTKKAIHLRDEVCWSMQCIENVLRNLVEQCLQVEEDSTMAQTKQASKRRRRKKALPVIGIAGVSLAMAGGASASTNGMATDTQLQNTSPRHEIFLGEEEISDVSLGTFHVFDKENAAKPQFGEKPLLAKRRRRLRPMRLRLETLRRLRRLRRLRMPGSFDGGCHAGWTGALSDYVDRCRSSLPGLCLIRPVLYVILQLCRGESAGQRC